MNYAQAVQEIAKAAPEIQSELSKCSDQNVYELIQIFMVQIRKVAKENKLQLLTSYLKKMNKIYRSGNIALKNAIENTFIYSLDNFTTFCNAECKKVIFNNISNDLRQIYLRQIYKSGM
ncbi:hypothetical protein CHRYSEOSP005_26230 [Chryseobacterium sp. Alg-005]|uniref:DUF7674 family protein n=1 Tax=Chryseobacterium sp. Alg-005 TaxID=3159516 RepID=UPI00355568AD